MRWISRFAGLCAALGCVGPVAADADEAWHELEATGYTVLSQLEERDTRHWVAYFDQFVAAMTGALDLRDAKRPPLTVMLFAKQSDLLAAAPSQSTGCDADPAAPHALAFAMDAPVASSSEALFHAAAHWITASMQGREPVWFVEGVAQLFSTFGLRGMEAHWGDSLSTAATLLRERGPIPMDVFLASAGGHTADADRYHAQALVVAHWAMFGRSAPLRQYLSTWGSDGSTAAPVADLTPALLAYLDSPGLGRSVRPRQISEQRYLMSRATAVSLGHALALLGAPVARPVQAFNGR